MQVSGDVSQVEAQLASLQQSLLHSKDLLQHKLQEEVSAHEQAEDVAQVCCCCQHKDLQSGVTILLPNRVAVRAAVQES